MASTEEQVETDLNQHMADVHMARLGGSMERGSLILMLHFKVGVNAVHWKTEQGWVQPPFRDERKG